MARAIKIFAWDLVSITHKGFRITKSVGSHCASIYDGDKLIAMTVGNIKKDGSTNVITKAKSYIDAHYKKS